MDDDDDDVREQHNTTTQTRKKERKKEKRLPQKRMRDLSKRRCLSSLASLLSGLLLWCSSFAPFIKERKRETKSHFFRVSKRHYLKVRTLECQFQIPSSSSQVLRGTLSTRDHTTHKREGPSSFWTSSYVILYKTFVQKNAGAARGVASRHRRFDDDVGPPSPRWWWWWWWFWVRSKTTKRVHHSKVFLERGNPDD